VQTYPESAAKAYVAAAIVAGIKTQTPALEAHEVEAEWLKLKARIAADNAQQEAKQIFMFAWTKMAIAAAILVSIGLVGYWAVMTPQTLEYSTGFGIKKNIVLADGTEINLNSNSKLTARSSWRFAPAREIWLEGEAYFKVVAHPNDESLKKFVVHTSDLDVNVVGTEFNVNARNNKTRVFLNEGKVKVTITEPQDVHTLELKPGDYISYAPKEKVAPKLTRKVEPAYIKAWKAGYFSFNKTPLAEVFDLVETSHDVVIKIDDPRILQEPLSGKISTNNLNGLFSSIASLYNLEYTRKGDEILFTTKKQ
jgi:ferric-dicitrate binding protein FerR (iron transport regulator)